LEVREVGNLRRIERLWRSENFEMLDRSAKFGGRIGQKFSEVRRFVRSSGREVLGGSGGIVAPLASNGYIFGASCNCGSYSGA
jgi:hypothetical protein